MYKTVTYLAASVTHVSNPSPKLTCQIRDRHFPPWWWDSFIFKKTSPPWERGWWDNFSHHGPEAGGIVFLLSHHGGGTVTVDMGWPAAGGKF